MFIENVQHLCEIVSIKYNICSWVMEDVKTLLFQNQEVPCLNVLLTKDTVT